MEQIIRGRAERKEAGGGSENAERWREEVGSFAVSFEQRRKSGSVSGLMEIAEVNFIKSGSVNGW